MCRHHLLRSLVGLRTLTDDTDTDTDTDTSTSSIDPGAAGLTGRMAG
jgi:hypothetical protein